MSIRLAPYLVSLVSCILLLGCSKSNNGPKDAGSDPIDSIPDHVADHVVDQIADVAADSAPASDVIGDFDTVDSAKLSRFSFFVTSLAALQELSGSQDGFGGDLRFGETGPGAGLRGADKICAAIAERSMPGSSVKKWRAFLSVTDDGSGKPVNAIDRVGDGPWYDRLGRLLAPTKADLLHPRPQNGYPLIRDDFPNEDGILNHQPDPTKGEVYNHHTMTGSNYKGTLYSNTATCKDWTVAIGDSANGKPRCGYSYPGAFDPYDSGHWMSGLSVPGCAPSVEIGGNPMDPDSGTVGGGSGYGAFYCFALVP